MCDAYCAAFKGPPWFEEYWTREMAKEVLDNASSQEGFIGLAALVNNEVVGFYWGYKFPKEKSTTVDFPAVGQKLNDMDIDTEDMFYKAEMGFVPNMQAKGIGTKIMKRMAEEIWKMGYESASGRTINENIVKLMNRSFGQVDRVFDDPQNSTPWYVLGK